MMTIEMNGYKINNVPAYAADYECIVARECADELWFWGAWRTYQQALEVAAEVGGVVVGKP